MWSTPTRADALPLSALVQLERGRVEAVALPRRLGSIGKDVPQVPAAGVAHHFRAAHPVGEVVSSRTFSCEIGA